jgi:hypothetical protein
MGIQKLPVQGTLTAAYVNVPGQTGPNYSTGVVTAAAANRVTISRFKLSGAAIVITSGRAVVTLASHLNTILGQQVTYSGGTGVLGLLLNDQTWTIDRITSSSVYEFACNLADGTATGTIVQEPVFTLPQGWTQVTMDANANVEMCVDNTNESPTGHSVAGVATAQTITPTGLMSWQKLVVGNATPLVNTVFSDGFATRIRCMGTTASSYFSYIG